MIQGMPRLAEAALLRSAMDAAGTAFLLFDRQDRLVFASRHVRELYGANESLLQPGRSFEAITRELVSSGVVPVREDRREAWLADRLRLHREGGSTIRQMPDGHWRRITEERLPDGSHLSYSIDVTELVHQREAVDRAHAEAQRARRQLLDAIEALPAGFSMFDADDRLVLSNRLLRDMHPGIADMLAQPGHHFEELMRAALADGARPGLSEAELPAYFRQRLEERRRGSSRHLVRTPTGWLTRIEQRAPDGHMISIHVDTTELIEQRQAAEAARTRLHDAIEAQPGGFALYDGEDRLVLCNTRFLEMHQQSAAAAVAGTRFEDFLRHGLAVGQYPQAAGDPLDWLAQRLAQHRHPAEPLLLALPGDRWLRVHERLTTEGGVAAVFTDITDLVRRERTLQRANAELGAARVQLEHLSHTDGLTGLANRRLFDNRLRHDWARTFRLHQPLSLLMVDVDHFKRFNDHHGHPAGDACLRRVAAALQAVVNREIDLVARYGGEEFVLLLPHTDADGAFQVACACLEAVDGSAIAHGDSPTAPHVTISVGLACSSDPSAGGSAERLLNAADAALLAAKNGGRHRIVRAPPR